MACEVSWFAALCDDDYEFLGAGDPRLLSSWEHCRDSSRVSSRPSTRCSTAA